MRTETVTRCRGNRSDKLSRKQVLASLSRQPMGKDKPRVAVTPPRSPRCPPTRCRVAAAGWAPQGSTSFSCSSQDRGQRAEAHRCHRAPLRQHLRLPERLSAQRGAGRRSTAAVALGQGRTQEHKAKTSRAVLSTVLAVKPLHPPKARAAPPTSTTARPSPPHHGGTPGAGLGRARAAGSQPLCALVLQALGVSDHFPVEFELKAKGGFFNWLKSKLSRKRRPRARRRSSS